LVYFVLNPTLGKRKAPAAYGDNDQLSAYVAHYFDADLLVILSDIDGLYDSNPKENPNAKLLKTITEIDKSLMQTPCNPNDKFATGGIVTKLQAAEFFPQMIVASSW
jgi:glutamate 5-kinase